jgi:protoporphyrinogen/coproporphyrinogen III oxidase
VASRLVPKRVDSPSGSAAEWFRANYGTAFADEVAIPLVEAWSGAPAAGLAASVGEKLGNSVWKVIHLKLASWRSRRAVACGYSQEMPESPEVWHVYPEGGLGFLCQRLAAGLEDAIRLDSPVDEILVDSGRVRAVRVKGREQPVSAVVSTAPCHILAKLVRGSEALRPLARFRYRPMAFVNMRFAGRGILPDTVLWIPWLAPEGKTLLTADIGCEVGDEQWRMSDEMLGARCVDHLDLLFPRIRERYLGCRVLRTPIAYPVFLKEYEADRRRFEQSSGVEGLYSIGRNGQFAHALMEDVYWRTLKTMRDLVAALAAPDEEPGRRLRRAG